MLTQNPRITGIVVTIFGLSPVVKDSGLGEFVSDFRKVVWPRGGVTSKPEEVEDTNGPVFFHRTSVFMKRKIPTKVISCWPESLSKEC